MRSSPFDDEPGSPMPAIDVALDALIDAVLDIAEKLTVDADIEPDDLLWSAQRVAVALEEVEGLFVELGDRAASWQQAVIADSTPALFGVAPAAERAHLVHLRAAPERLYAAARAVRLAARRGHLVELEALRRPASTRLRVADAWLDVTLLDEQRATYGVRVVGAPAGDPTAPGVSDGELVRAIAAATGLELAQTEQRQHARAAAEQARRALNAIVTYRDSGRRGDPQHAERLAPLADAANIGIPYSHRPDFSQDLVDVLLDVHAERWPVAAVLRDSLAAAAQVLTEDAARDKSGVDRLLEHPNEDAAAAEHVRELVGGYVAPALEPEDEARQPRGLRDE